MIINKKYLSIVIVTIVLLTIILKVSGLGEILVQHKNKNELIGSNDSFNIALVTPRIKNAVSAQALSAENGIKAAIEHLNSSTGVLEKKINYIFIGSDELGIFKDRGKNQAIPDIFIVQGGDAFIKSTIEILKTFGKPIFYLGFGRCKTLSNLTEKKVASLIYGIGLTWESTLEPLILNLIEKAYPKNSQQNEIVFSASYFAADMEDERELLAGIKSTAEDLDVKTTVEKYADIRIADYFEIIQTIIASRSSFLFISNPYLAGQIFLKQAAQQSISRDTILVGPGTIDQELISLEPQATNGAYTVSSYFANLDTKENSVFKSELLKVNNSYKSPSETAFAAYSSVLFAAEAYNRLNSINNEQFDQMITSIKLHLANGEASINQENHIIIQEHFILRAENGGLKQEEKLSTAIHPRLDGCY